MPRAKKSIKTKRDPQGRFIRFGAIFGFSFGSLLAALQASMNESFGPHTGKYVWPIAVIGGPLVGYFIGNLLDQSVSGLFAGAFGRQGGDIGPQHSPGETLLQQEKYAEATRWFSERYLTNPKDWRAQARLVEILAEHFDDEEHLVGEKNRLLKAEKVPEGLWCRTAFEVASYREANDRPKQAILLYRMLSERYPDTWEAKEARERLQDLEPGRISGDADTSGST